MDYILVGLWALLCGGLLWTGSSNKSIQTADIKSKTLVAEEQSLVEIPQNNVAKPFKVSNAQQTTIVETPQQQSADQAQALAFKQSKKQNNVNTDKPKSSVFDKPRSKTTDKADLANANMQQQRDTVIVFRVTTNDDQSVAEVVMTPDQLNQLPTDVEELSITEPLFDPEPVAPSRQVYKQQGLKLPGQMTVDQLMCDQDGAPMRHILVRGESLTQIAQKYYHEAIFWPYVFEVNRFQLSSPDKIQADMKLYLPDPLYYGIDANKPESIDKARALKQKYQK